MQLRVAARAYPWLAVVAAAGGVAGSVLVLRCTTPTDVVSALPCVNPTDATATAATVDVYVKLKPGATLPDSRPLFTHLPAGTDDERSRWRVVARLPGAIGWLTADPFVVEAYQRPDIAPVLEARTDAPTADDSCPITTPSYDELQGYVGPAPAGIDAPAAWGRNLRGQGVWFADIEGGWNASHEDLPGDRIFHVAGRSMRDTGWRAHGTAVLGEVVGRANGKGVTGLAPDVERVFTSSIDGQAVGDAIDAAAEKLRAGDVLLIELQGTGPRGRFLPVEYWDDVYDAVHAATDRGIVVIEAAGNGYEDLDRKDYKGKLSRSGRDSGAIMVGAGGPPRPKFTDRARLDFSNYGTRVDVQGWGRMVATLDYGDLQSCDDRSRDRHYTNLFSGTSSASPIIAGAAILLEQAYGRTLPPRDVRARLVATGTPQTGDTSQHIGPRPDLARALPTPAIRDYIPR